MLVITRKKGESIHIGDLNASQVRVAISAPESIAIVRSELIDTAALKAQKESVLTAWYGQVDAFIRRCFRLRS